MPMYDFICSACNHQFEDLIMGDETPVCPLCGGETKKLVSAPSPLKTGAFPFKLTPAPAHLTTPSAASSCGSACQSCGGKCSAEM